MKKFGNAVVRAFDRCLDDQKRAPGDVAFSLNQFGLPDDFLAGPAFPLYRVPPLAVVGYSPTSQGTALLDGLSDTITGIDRRNVNGASVVVVIITDGEENASEQATWESVFVEVTARIVRGWRFIFIGANQDAVKVAGRLGIPADCALTFAASGGGVGAAFRAASANLLAWRGGGQLAFNDNQRAEQRLLLQERTP
jgi:hypothetical protein